MAKQAVLLLAHGTPQTLEEIPAYLRNVTSGRPLPPQVVEEIQHRYSLIGRSPLTELTMEQARLAEAELVSAGLPVPVYVGMRNWRPYIPDVVRQMRADGIEEAAVICLAPQNSRTSVGLYRRSAEAEAGSIRIDFTAGWARHPQLIEAFAERLLPAWTRLQQETGAPVPVLFTAHSVPSRTVEPAADGQPADPYAEEARATADLVAACLPPGAERRFAFQSQGQSGGPWLGPTVEETLDALAAAGAKALLLHPIGFLCDHVEILYDVDIAFRDAAAQRGLCLERPASLNASLPLARALADLARLGLQRLAASSSKA
jgi:ferrochelatase